MHKCSSLQLYLNVFHFQIIFFSEAFLNKSFVLQSEVFEIVFTFSLAGVAIKPLRSGSMPPSSTILQGLKNAL